MENGQGPLDRELREAEQTLKTSLDEACTSDPVRADTGELIRIEEMLAIATDAAKKAISIRRKRKHGPRRPAGDAPIHEAVDEGAHRTFLDATGCTWTVWAVHPVDRPETKPRLRGTYQQGWLAFECDREKRRLSPIPDDWSGASDDGLRALLSMAEAAPRRADARPPLEER